LPDDFASELARGMESLMREIAAESGVDLNDVPGASGNGERRGLSEEERKEQERKFAAAWEAMLVEGMNGHMNADELSGELPAAGSEETFQQTIKKAMEKLKESDSNLQVHATAGSADSLEALLAQFEGLGEGGAESEEELHGVLETMMSQLMSKDVLYEPLKELYEKFPSYLKEHDSTLKAEDKKRFESQFSVVSKIVAVFDDPSYSDEDPQKGVRIIELMNEMQSYGSPPSEVMGPLPPGLDLGPDGMPKLPEGCTIA
ncbi:Pex19 protein, partial [Obba rivulosa]